MQIIQADEATKTEVLQNNPYFKGLNQEILFEIIDGMRLYQFENGETVFWEGDDCAGLHMIRQGSVKLFKISPQGRELIIRVLDEGATFNEVPVFDFQPNPVNVSTVEDSEIWIIDHSTTTVEAALDTPLDPDPAFCSWTRNFPACSHPHAPRISLAMIATDRHFWQGHRHQIDAGQCKPSPSHLYLPCCIFDK